MRALCVSVAMLALAGCASDPMPMGGETPPLPPALAAAADLRGAYRAALCARADMGDDGCARTLYRFAGETPAPRPAAADAARYRLLFVPGFMATCFPSIHSFADVADAARAAGFDAQVLDVGGRDGVAASADRLAAHLASIPDDGRRIIVVAHSKGVVDTLELLAARPNPDPRVVAVLSVAGALQGSPLADRLHGLYHATLGVFPFAGCARGAGDAVADMQPARRQRWWARYGPRIPVPVYALVSIPELDRLSTTLLAPFGGLARTSRYNDGMLLAEGQVAAPVRLLGVVNADHITVAIPYPGNVPWVLMLSAAPFARPQVVLAAIDVIVAETSR
ncbi:MAG: hypothetical protein U1F15_09175 [Burkholderiales bacterium]